MPPPHSGFSRPTRLGHRRTSGRQDCAPRSATTMCGSAVTSTAEHVRTTPGPEAHDDG